MEEIRLDVQLRKEVGSRKIKALRIQEDIIPGVVYGGERGPTTIKIDRRSYEMIMRKYRGQSVIFHLNVLEGEKKLRDYAAIVREEQHEPVSYNLLHIDFIRISLKKEIEVKVPIEARGEATGVKDDGGSLDQPLRELDIVCLPTIIPPKIEVDISELGIGSAIHVRDLTLPEGVKTKHDLDAIVISIVPPMKEEVAVAEEESEEPEIIKDKKDKEETVEETKEEDKKEEG